MDAKFLQLGVTSPRSIVCFRRSFTRPHNRLVNIRCHFLSTYVMAVFFFLWYQVPRTVSKREGIENITATSWQGNHLQMSFDEPSARLFNKPKVNDYASMLYWSVLVVDWNSNSSTALIRLVCVFSGRNTVYCHGYESLVTMNNESILRSCRHHWLLSGGYMMSRLNRKFSFHYASFWHSNAFWQ